MLTFAGATEPPPDLVKRVSENERENESARLHYTYRQSVVINEVDPKGGRFRDVREVIFLPSGERTERAIGRAFNNLSRLLLTPEDFEDIRNIQPLMFTPEMLPRYQVRFRGEERVDGADCWVLEIVPRQVFSTFRMFEGMAWVEKESLTIIRTYGQAVPAIRTSKSENLFPRFTTIRERIDGKHWFPVLTHADDVLPFRTGAIRMRLEIRYTEYKRFGAESVIKFDPVP